MSKTYGTVNLFWTGGWDSTFRLLQLLLIKEKQVQPYYIKFPSQESDKNNLPVRRSTQKEIETMDKIRKRLYEEYPFTKELLFETQIVEAKSIEPDKTILESFKKITEEIYIGNQYELLARFAEQYKLNDIEIGIEKDSNAYNHLEKFIVEDNFSNSKIDKSLSPEFFYNLFKYFCFPLFKYNKMDIQTIAKQKNWSKILDLTWFCHRPLFGKFPCGSCNPCIYAFEDGLGWRIPFLLRITGRLNKRIYNSTLITKIRSLLSKN